MQVTDVRETEQEGAMEAINDVDEKHLERKCNVVPQSPQWVSGQAVEQLVSGIILVLPQELPYILRWNCRFGPLL
jgi:hypothetical protein